MRSAQNPHESAGPRRHAAGAHRAAGKPRTNRFAAIGCAAVLITAGAGVTAYARTAGHAKPTALSSPRAVSDAPKTPLTPSSTSGAGTQSAVPMQNSTKLLSSATPDVPDAMSVSDPLEGTAFSGQSQVGTLFRTSDGSLTSHHCSGSVVSSPKGDIVLTAAHCVYDTTGAETGLAFVPKYDDGSMPYGTWNVSAVYVAPQWVSDRDPDYDVAFVVVHKSGSSTSIQDEVGSDKLAVNQAYNQLTTVIGYPSDTNAPITCTNYTTEFSSTQLKFDCADYPGGTSGSPFLTHVDMKTGYGTVDGVLGGYQEGGDTDNVSYSVHFGDAVSSLFAQAEQGS